MTLERNPESASATSPLRIGIVPGVTPDKWTRRWAERHPDIPFAVVPVDDADARNSLDSGLVTVCFLRLPADADGLSVIRLYEEMTVLAVSRDSPLVSEEQVTALQVAEFSGVVNYPVESSIKDAMAVVAAGVGAFVLPSSVARMAARKDVVTIPIADAPDTEVAVCWRSAETTVIIEEFIGIVRGRTTMSSRGTAPTTKRARRRGR